MLKKRGSIRGCEINKKADWKSFYIVFRNIHVFQTQYRDIK